MKIFRDDKKITRNARIGQFTTFGGLVVLGGGMWITFSKPDWIGPAWACLLIGFLLSQIGIYFGNRFGRRPRPDEILDAALKGMDDRWAIYHYFNSLADHILIGPGGIWLLKPYHQVGKLVRNPKNKRWQVKGGGVIQAYLRIFAQESIGRPDLEIDSETESLKRFISKQNETIELPALRTALVMTNVRTEIDEDIDSDDHVYAITAGKLKELIRKQTKENNLSPIKLNEIQAALGGEEVE